jgi:hypothetical protein
MQKKPITYAEKIQARYERKHRDLCWMWEGNCDPNGQPRMNLRLVTRYIYEQEFGPIPEGYTLWRKDHSDECNRKKCRHHRCVNPYHLQPMRRFFGTHERENKAPDPSSQEWLDYLSERDRQRKRKKEENAIGRDSQVHDVKVHDRGDS